MLRQQNNDERSMSEFMVRSRIPLPREAKLQMQQCSSCKHPCIVKMRLKWQEAIPSGAIWKSAVSIQMENLSGLNDGLLLNLEVKSKVSSIEICCLSGFEKWKSKSRMMRWRTSVQAGSKIISGLRVRCQRSHECEFMLGLTRHLLRRTRIRIQVLLYLILTKLLLS